MRIPRHRSLSDLSDDDAIVWARMQAGKPLSWNRIAIGRGMRAAGVYTALDKLGFLRQYRTTLEGRFRQDVIVIRAIPHETL